MTLDPDTRGRGTTNSATVLQNLLAITETDAAFGNGPQSSGVTPSKDTIAPGNYQTGGEFSQTLNWPPNCPMNNGENVSAQKIS